MAFANGITSFSRLQRRGRERVAVFLYLFDVLRLDGEDMRGLPLREARRGARGAAFDGPVRYTPHRNGQHGEEMYREACARGSRE